MKVTSMLRAIIFIAICLCFPSFSYGQEFSYVVKEEHMLKDHKGEIKIFSDRIEFTTENSKQPTTWDYNTLRMVEVLSPKKLRLYSYEDQVWLLGKDKQFTFQVVEGELDYKLVDFLRSRVKRPFVVAFAQADVTDNLLAEIAVKHFHRLGGCQGTLKIYQTKLVFTTPDGHDSREWLWADIQTLSHPDQWQLELTSYEPAIGVSSRSYRFALKEAVSEQLYEQIWQKVYRPTILKEGLITSQ